VIRKAQVCLVSLGVTLAVRQPRHALASSIEKADLDGGPEDASRRA
jgi:hypothetical protein